MGIPYSTARWAAPLSFAIDFAAQQYGMLSSPNMKDVHDANLSFYSPQPYFIAGFFFPQQIFQLVWLYRLWKIDPKESAEKKRESQLVVDFVPYYLVGNLCIATWMIFWNSSALKTSNLFVLINSFTQLYYIFFRLPTMNTSSKSSVLTNVVSKTFAGIGVLDFLHNGSVAYFNHESAGTAVKVLTGLGFGGLAMASDWIFGGCLVYDLVALAVGQRGRGETGWSNLLVAYAVGVGAIVAGKNFARPPYVKEDISGYEPAETDDLT